MPGTTPLPIVADSLPTTFCLLSIDPSENRYCFSRLIHQRRLWNEAVLAQTRGRLGTEGRSRLCFRETTEQALMGKRLRRRLQLGVAVLEQRHP
jgi:hypothetical protein